MTRVKICGITNLADARHAVESGADALGFIFAVSPRQVTPDTVRRIVEELPPWIAAVGVFVDEKPEKVRRISESCRLTDIQLHGSESAAVARTLMRDVRVIKAFRVGPGFEADVAAKYEADAFLFDSRIEGLAGGTGKTFDWDLVRRRFDRPMIVSGGLNAKNVGKAIRLLKPFGVDTSSGVERAPGKKDPKLVEEFIRHAKRA